jgi:ornithine carbamoyltransferase
MAKNLISISDLSKDEIISLFSLTVEMKKGKYDNLAPLKNKLLAMIFYKPSTRTSISFASGMYQLGGLPIILTAEDLQLKRGESLSDTARVFSLYVDGVVIRTMYHEDIIEFAKYSSIPVINGLTDLEHPCQVLSDVYTLYEKKCNFSVEELKKLKIVYVGDPNNVCNSWCLISGILGLNFTISCPPNYGIDERIKEKINGLGVKISIISDPYEAVKDADVVYTDVWVSMGKESSREQRIKDFQKYQVNTELLSKAKGDCSVMHCLPANRGEEITSEVMDSDNSLIFDQAENRLHLQKALLLKFLKE